MGSKSIKNIVVSKNYVISSLLISCLKDKSISKNSLFVLIYYLNNDNYVFNPEKLCNDLYMSLEDVMICIMELTKEGLIEIVKEKDNNNKLYEVISLNKLVERMNEEVNNMTNKEIKTDIFSVFEAEFGRTLSRLEFEIINGWLSANISEELIIGALKEAIYNGVRNLRYIDKIIYEWRKLGYKSMEDVNKRNNEYKKKNNNEELFDYDWLKDDN